MLYYPSADKRIRRRRIFRCSCSWHHKLMLPLIALLDPPREPRAIDARY
jgi:hypothetical protein